MTIIDDNHRSKAEFGAQPHWELLRKVMRTDLYAPLEAEIVRLVNEAIATNPSKPFISSRQAGADALASISIDWHARFNREFQHFPNGSAAALFGMALWHYLATRDEDEWRFTGVADPYGFGWDATAYWRP